MKGQLFIYLERKEDFHIVHYGPFASDVLETS